MIAVRSLQRLQRSIRSAWWIPSLVLVIAVLSPFSLGSAMAQLTLDNVFNDSVGAAYVPDLFTRVLGPSGFNEQPGLIAIGTCPVRVYKYVVKGPTAAGFRRCDWDGRAVNSSGCSYCPNSLPSSVPQTRTCNLDIEIYLPQANTFLDDSNPAVPAQAGLFPRVVVRKGDFSEQQKRMAAILLAQEQIPTVLWEQHDDGHCVLNDPSNQQAPCPSPNNQPCGANCGVSSSGCPIARQFGYANDGNVQPVSLRWMMRKYEDLGHFMGLGVLRLDERYALAQCFILSHVFYREFIKNTFGLTNNHPYLQNLKVVFSGGSKEGGAALTAAGAENRTAIGGPNRAAGVLADAYQGWDASNRGGFARYQTDWGFYRNPNGICPYGLPRTCQDGNPDYQHALGPFAVWSLYQHCDPSSSSTYYRVYVPSKDPNRYKDLMILDVTHTHDNNFPLGSSQRLWFDHDGLDSSGNPSVEPRWNFRLLRAINKGHGVRYLEPLNGSASTDCFDNSTYLWSAQDLLGMQMMRQLRDPNDVLDPVHFKSRFPRIEVASFTAPPQGNWTIRVRVTNLRNPDPEDYKVHFLQTHL